MMMPMMATLDRAGDDNGIRAMMSTTVVIEGNRAVLTVMKTLTLVVDDLDVGCDDDVSFGCRRYRRHRYEQRQSAHDHCFHCNISICNYPFAGITASYPFGSEWRRQFPRRDQ